MKKIASAKFKFIFAIAALVIILILGFIINAQNEARKIMLLLVADKVSNTTVEGTNDELISSIYSEQISEYARTYGVEDYVDVLNSIIRVTISNTLWQTDPMMSSDFATNQLYLGIPIIDTNYSIESGVAEFAELIKLSNCNGRGDEDTLKLVVQAYNCGRGYISYVQNGIGYYDSNDADIYIDTLGASKVNTLYMPNFANTVFDMLLSTWINPLAVMTVSSEYGYRHYPGSGEYKLHKGVDLTGAKGTPVFASTNGRVLSCSNSCNHDYPKSRSCGCNGGAGNFIKIQTADGYVIEYYHLTQYNTALRKNSLVSVGDIIGWLGCSGYSTGNHLHYGVYEVTGFGTRQYYNPRDFLTY